ncbi:aminotransferase class V-fold PLP-dependent enzyme [Streptomyces sp. NPDC048057]|uniref:aminotransferase class V-fold PLP-dependent enzyme n=1 Tax=Streptomyces sp. NPDC048057 TaxID=3155628 RepID=UPI0033F845AD
MNVDELLPHALSGYDPRPLADRYPGLVPGIARFDGPGGTLTHAAVRDAMAAYLGSPHVANDHGGFPASDTSDRIARWARDRVRALLGASGGQVVFGPNMTTLAAAFTRAVAAGGGLRSGDEVLCTELDHEANVRPWRAVAERCGARVRMVPLPATGILPAEDVAERITERTRWVAITAASNALGTVPDLRAVVGAAHAVGARVFVDAVQAVAHRALDAREVGVDALVTAAYKWYGPHAGALWVSDEVADDLTLPEQVESAGTALPDRLELGTSNFEAMLGTGVAAELLLRRDRGAVVAEEGRLAGLLMEGLQEAGAQVLGPGPSSPAVRVPVVAFRVPGQPARTAAARLAAAGIWLWHGTFYAHAAMRAVTPDGTAPDALRAGIAAYTTEEDVRTLVRAVRALHDGVPEHPAATHQESR